MAKKIILIGLMFFLFVASAFAYPFEVKDSTGYVHYFVEPPRRIVSAIPSITEMLFALGLDKEIKGVTQNCSYPPKALGKAKIGRETINIEVVVALHPHLVIMLEDAQKIDVKRLRNFGLPVFTINPHTIVDVERDLLLLGKVTHTDGQAEKTVLDMEKRLKEARAKTDKPGAKPIKALVVVGIKPLIVAGGGTFIADILAATGVENLAKNALAAYPLYSMEQLIKDPPDIIIIPEGVVKNPQEIYNDSRWSKLEPVKEHRVLFIDPDIISRPGPRVVDAVEKIVDFIYNLE